MSYTMGLRTFCFEKHGYFLLHQEFQALAEPIIQQHAEQIHKRIAEIYEDRSVGLWQVSLEALYETQLGDLFYKLVSLMFMDTKFRKSWWTDLAKMSTHERRWVDQIHWETCRKKHRENSHPVNSVIVRTRKIMAEARKRKQDLDMSKTSSRESSAELWRLCAEHPCKDILWVVVSMSSMYLTMAAVFQTQPRPKSFAAQLAKAVE